ncbi:MAG: prepilin peptidase [bacterium]|nr:prepilin peptidase [bacterium]
MEEIILIVLGLIVGSFLNVLIHRLPLEESIVKPGSHCPSCKTPIRFYDNIPVISYLLLGGKCRSCKIRVSLLYPGVEAFTAFSFWLCYARFGPDLVYVGFSALFICLLITLALIDYEHMILPLELTIGGAVVFLVYSFFNPALTPVDVFASAVGGALTFAAIYVFYIKVRKIEGLGQGDIWMMLLLGAFLGINKLVTSILISSLTGALVGIFLIIFQKKNLKLALPFGTFLSLGSYIALFWGIEILKYIQGLYK